jgi:hypothetical protein
MHAAAGRANPVLHGGEEYIVFDSSGGEGIGEVQVQVCALAIWEARGWEVRSGSKGCSFPLRMQR